MRVPIPDPADPTGRRGWLYLTDEDLEAELDRMLWLAVLLSFRSWPDALLAWVLNTP